MPPRRNSGRPAPAAKKNADKQCVARSEMATYFNELAAYYARMAKLFS